MIRRQARFFFNDTATTEIYTLSLHDALPIYTDHPWPVLIEDIISHLYLQIRRSVACVRRGSTVAGRPRDRKSTRLNSSHANISYAVFCLKKKHLCGLLLKSSDGSVRRFRLDL